MNPSFVSVFLTLSGMSAQFGYLVDQGRAAECAKLFAPAARMIFAEGSPRPGTLEGLESIRTFLINRQAQTHVTTRHQATNFQLEWDGDVKAKLESLLTVFRSDGPSRPPIVSVVCDIHELFTRDEAGKWHIQERVTMPVFVKAT